MSKKYWRIGVEYIYPELFEKGYPYVHGGAVSGYREENGKKTRRKEYISSLSKIKMGDIIVAGGANRVDFIGEVIENPAYLFQGDGPAWNKSFENDFNIHEADDETKKAFQKILDDNEGEHWDVICIKTNWYSIPDGLWMPVRQPPGPCNEITNPKVIKYINKKIKQCDGSQQMEKWVTLVKSGRNAIFTGAPGTGKTFLAKEIARQIVGPDNEASNTEFVQFHPSHDYTDFVEGLRPVDKGEMQIGFKLEDGIFKQFCKKAIANEDKKFVFIIDEINRGEIGKIFGELFFSLDPGYRGEKGNVKTQYYNLIPKGDIFKEGFYVPENVYIIGTMNDIDRSVESFDFAMRRRFTWIEISASETADGMFGKEIPQFKEEAVKRLNALNDAISDIETLNESYHIGGAYFLKLKEHDGDYEKLWEYHLFPVLREYLRGTEDIEENMDTLKKAYDLSPAENNGDDDDQDEG